MMQGKTFYERSEEVIQNQSELVKLVCNLDGDGKDEVLKLLETVFKDQIELVCLLDDLEQEKRKSLSEISIPSFLRA